MAKPAAFAESPPWARSPYGLIVSAMNRPRGATRTKNTPMGEFSKISRSRPSAVRAARSALRRSVTSRRMHWIVPSESRRAVSSPGKVLPFLR